MLKFDHVSKRYSRGDDALLDVSFHLQTGQMAFLTGHSGAGKSTLLKLAAMLERNSRGQIFLDGQNLNQVNNREVPYIRRKLGLIFQDNKLLQEQTVFHNVALPLVIAGHSPRLIAAKVRAALDKVGLLKKEKSLPQTLSGGELQRVGIARAVVNKPRLILADEPTGNLDPELSAEVMHLFAQFQQVGVTILIASHDIELLSQLDYRVLKLAHGRLEDRQK